MSSLQSSMEDDHTHRGLSGTQKLLGSQASNLHPHTKNRRGPIGYKKMSSMQLNKNYQPNNAQAFNNSIFTLGDYKGNMGNIALD